MVRLLSSIAVYTMLAAAAVAAPNFAGISEALPAPGAAVLRWERAAGTPANITYRVYQRTPQGWNFSRPIAEVKGQDWVVTGLQPNVQQEFIVRARDASGEDNNTRSARVTPNGNFPTEEWRAVWVQRFEWTSGDRTAVENRLRQMFQTLASGNLNAVVFQVRGQGDTLYPSATEPWSPVIRDASVRASDPIAFAINEAKRNNIEFHAWINFSVIWQSAQKVAPSDRNHPFYLFADTSNPARSRGVVHDTQGRPNVWGKDGYVWLTHGNPEVNAYLRQQAIAFLRKYPVDGLHIDDRTGDPNGVSRDPVSVQRFQGRGNPMRIGDMGEWQRDQLTRFLSDLYAVAKAERPNILVSASPFGIADKNRIPGYGRFSDCIGFGVQPERWLALGVIDVLTPQMYWDLPDPEPNFGTVLRDWMRNNRTGRPIWPGSALGKYGDVQPIDPVQIQYIAMARALSAASNQSSSGNTFYHYSGAQPAQWASLARTAYPTKARVPVPPHMRNPQTGQIIGVVTRGGQQPIVDCWLTVNGVEYVYLSSADGFFAMPNLRPGSYTLRADAGGGMTKTATVTVRPGQTSQLRVDF